MTTLATQFKEKESDLGVDERAILIELLRRRKDEAIRYFEPNVGAQEEFIKLVRSKREVAYFAGNKSGKCVAADTLISGQRIDSFGFEKGSAPLLDLGGLLRVAPGHRVLTPTGWHTVSTKEPPLSDRFVALLQTPALSSGDISLSDFLSGDARSWRTVSDFQADYLAYFRSHGGLPQPLSAVAQDGLPLPVGASACIFAERYAREHSHLYRYELPLSIDHALHPVHHSFSVSDLDALPPAEQSLPNILVFDLSVLPSDLRAKVLLGAEGLDVDSSLVYIVMWQERKIYSILIPVNIITVEGEAEEAYWDTTIPFIHAYEAGGFINHNTYTAAFLTVLAALGKDAAKYGHEPLYQEQQHVWVGSVNYKVQREAAQIEVERWVPEDMIKKVHHLQNGVYDRIDLKGGGTIGFKTFDQGRASWQGPVKGFIWCDEEPPMDIISEARARLTAPDSKMIFSLTPLLGVTKLYKQFVEEKEAYRGHVFGSTYENKANIDPLYIKSLENLPEDEKQMRLYGQFTRLGGLVYPEFDRRLHVIPHFEPDPKQFIVIGGMDFGADHPTAFILLAIDVSGQVFAFREYKAVGPMEIHKEAFQVMCMNQDTYTPYDVKAVFSDPSAKQAAIELRYGKNKVRVRPGNRDRMVGISLIRQLLRDGNLIVSDACPQLIYEFEHHQRKDPNRDGEQKDVDVKKTDDDLLDALRYATASHFRPKKEEDTLNPIHKAGKGGLNQSKGLNW